MWFASHKNNYYFVYVTFPATKNTSTFVFPNFPATKTKSNWRSLCLCWPQIVQMWRKIGQKYDFFCISLMQLRNWPKIWLFVFSLCQSCDHKNKKASVGHKSHKCGGKLAVTRSLFQNWCAAESLEYKHCFKISGEADVLVSLKLSYCALIVECHKCVQLGVNR